ncbi:MAG TPA: glycosyltransferase [Thermoanaerobaculaceae bacterium]|nr:glycosyltransferase [Thermoanaerobaculaceae bacterium]HPS77454.1 glycosyltransferase [Thermoanaerobaculaceae bacterium]
MQLEANQRLSTKTPLVSLVTPTRDRHELLPFAYRWVQSLAKPEWEWVVLDDTDHPCTFMAELGDPRVRYERRDPGLTLGAKRNAVVALARGAIVVHLDDDDFYAPAYLSRLLDALAGGAGLAKLGSWYVYSVGEGILGHVDMTRPQTSGWEMSARGVRRVRLGGDGLAVPVQGPDVVELETPELGWGFSFAYRREAWERCPFPDVNWNEDGIFATRVAARWGLAVVPDTAGLCLHLVHAHAASASFPEVLLPPGELRRLFPPAVEDLIAAVRGLPPARSKGSRARSRCCSR